MSMVKRNGIQRAHTLLAQFRPSVFVLASGILACEAFAQSPSQITPRSFEPSPPVQGGEIVIPESTGPEAPAGAEQLFVDIAGVEVEGGFPALREQEQAVASEIAGKRVSAADSVCCRAQNSNRPISLRATAWSGWCCRHNV